MQTSRRAARLILVDEHDRVLLLQHARPNGSRFWATPGHSLRDGESFDSAAERCLQDFGLSPDTDLLRGWSASSSFPSGGRLTFQEEQYFLAWVTSFPVDERLLGDGDGDTRHVDSVLAVRWWSRGQLASPPPDEALFPRDLFSQLQGWIGRRSDPKHAPDTEFGALFDALDSLDAPARR